MKNSSKETTKVLLQFQKDTDFDKLFINTEYVFDVIFWVETNWVKDLNGTDLHLRNVVAVQRQKSGSVEIFLNVASDEDACDPNQEPIENFENGLEFKQQILDFLNEHMSEINYNIKDKILDVSEIETSIKDVLNRHIEEDGAIVYNKIRNMKEVPFNLELKHGIKFENTIHYAKDKNCYLLESRLFDDGKGGQMLDAYLRIINADMTLVDNRILTEQYCDDAWEYADWKALETNEVYKFPTYTCEGIEKLTYKEALKTFKEVPIDDYDVFLLFGDNTMSKVTTESELMAHNNKCGEFGVLTVPF